LLSKFHESLYATLNLALAETKRKAYRLEKYSLQEDLYDGAGMRENLADDQSLLLDDGEDFVAEIYQSRLWTKRVDIGI
jgi:hypothetical protein